MQQNSARQIFRNWGMQLDDYGLKFHQGNKTLCYKYLQKVSCVIWWLRSQVSLTWRVYSRRVSLSRSFKENVTGIKSRLWGSQMWSHSWRCEIRRDHYLSNGVMTENENTAVCELPPFYIKHFVCIKYLKNQEVKFGFMDVILLHSGHIFRPLM